MDVLVRAAGIKRQLVEHLQQKYQNYRAENSHRPTRLGSVHLFTSPRSSAAALIMYACWLGPGREHEAMMRVLQQLPIAVPNRRMAEIADRLLAREGRLLAVLSSQLW